MLPSAAIAPSRAPLPRPGGARPTPHRLLCRAVAIENRRSPLPRTAVESEGWLAVVEKEERRERGG